MQVFPREKPEVSLDSFGLPHIFDETISEKIIIQGKNLTLRRTSVSVPVIASVKPHHRWEGHGSVM